MKLNELSTTWETHRVITYNADSTRAIYKNVPMRHVAGSLYAGEPYSPEYSSETFVKVYVWFAAQDIGMITREFTDDFDLEGLIDYARLCAYTTAEDYITKSKMKLDAGLWLKLTEVELLKNLAPELVTPALEAREAHRRKREEEEKRRREEEAAEDARYVEERNAEAEAAVEAAVEIIKRGGPLRNTAVTFYNSRYDTRETTVVAELINRLKIPAALRTKGWIKNTMSGLDVSPEGRASRYYYLSGNGSEAAWKVLNALIAAVRAA